jgi:hypothetical protein
MAINENDLLKVGFTSKDIARIQRALAHHGGTLEELLTTLSNRFRAATWITSALALVYIVTVVAGNRTHILTGGLAVLITLLIVWGAIPVSLSRKARRFRKLNL